jgi:hypothetical protein
MVTVANCRNFVQLPMSVRGTAMSETAIQIQDLSGVWRTVHTTCDNNTQRISSEMRSAQSRYPKYRVRAVDRDGHLIDVL